MEPTMDLQPLLERTGAATDPQAGFETYNHGLLQEIRSLTERMPATAERTMLLDYLTARGNQSSQIWQAITDNTSLGTVRGQKTHEARG